MLSFILWHISFASYANLHFYLPQNSENLWGRLFLCMKNAPEITQALLLSRLDAARALGISLRSLAYLVADKRLPTRRIGRRVLIPAAAVRRYALADHPEQIRT